MKFGIRTPSLRKSIAARTSIKRVVRHNFGLKAPRGFGWITNSKKALYNRIYNRTSFSIFKGGSIFRWLGIGVLNNNAQDEVSDEPIVEDNKGINSVKIVVNILVLFTLFLFFYGLQDDISRHYKSSYWNNGMRDDLRLFGGFLELLALGLIVGFDTLLSWLTIIFMGYMLYNFVSFLELYFLSLLLGYFIIRLILRKLS
ncbi:MAG: hypothetical protein WCP61_07965 [Chitinophagia bacterium]